MAKYHLPILESFRWGFIQAARDLKGLLPLSALFYVPELQALFFPGLSPWPLIVTQLYKTTVFFVLLFRAFKRLEVAKPDSTRNKPADFAIGEAYKWAAQISAGLLGIALALLFLKLCGNSLPVISNLREISGSLAEARAWWMALPRLIGLVSLALAATPVMLVLILSNFFGYIIADQGLSAVDSLKASVQMSLKSFFPLCLFYALCALLVAAGLWLWVIGALFTFPVTLLATVYIYRHLSGAGGGRMKAKKNSSPYDPRFGLTFGTDRAKAFSDGVFSIVITLLILELKVPQLSEPLSGSELIWALVDLWPKFLSYFISFFVIGIFWIAHHNLFNYVHRTNRIFLWLNNLFLLAVSFIPFPAAMLGSYRENKIAMFLYGVTLTAVGVMLNLMWAYAWKHREHLMNEHATERIIKGVRILVLTPAVCYGLAALLALIRPDLSFIVFAIIPVLYILPGPLEAVLKLIHRETR